jgi:hypothetical protein
LVASLVKFQSEPASCNEVVGSTAYVFVAAPSFRLTFANTLRTEGRVASLSSIESPPFSSLISSINALASARDSEAIRSK